MSLTNTSKKYFSLFFDIFCFAFIKAYLNLKDSKELTKENITKSLTLVNFFCFWLSVFPFLSFVSTFYFSGKLETISLNFPGLIKNSNQVFWETLLTPFDYSEKLTNTLKNVDIHSNAILLNHTKINPSIQTLVECYEHSNKTNKNQSFPILKELKPRELTNPKNLDLLQFRDLDEIPYKLESNIRNFKEDNTKIFNSENNSDFLKILNKKNFLSNSTNIKSKNFKLALVKEKNKLRLIKTKPFLNSFQPTFFTNREEIRLNEWKNFSHANELLLRYFRSTIVTFNSIELEKSLKAEVDFIRPRSMTWYNYPDMNTNQIWRFELNQAYSKDNSVNSITVASYPKSIYFSEFSTIPFKTKIVSPYFDVIKLNNDDSTSYVLKHNFQNSDLFVENKKEFQTSFFENVIQNNVESNKSLYFFANLTKEGIETLNGLNQKIKSEQKEKQLLNLNHSIVQTSSFFGLPDSELNESEIKKIYDPKFSDILGENYSNLIQLSDLRTGEILYYYSNRLNKNPKNLVQNEEITKNRKNVTLNFSNQLIKLNNPLFEYSSNLYKRELSSYWKNKLKFNETDEFLTIHESINLNSIFSISLLGFLISTFLILKTAYADYAKEFSSYLLDLISSGKGLPLDPSTIEWLNQELGIEEKKGGIRVFAKGFSQKRFTDIAGIKFLLPELSELVWFLRNKGRKFSVTQLASKSVLLVGPPGTGKTLLVQALAAEAEVPVVAQSTSVLSGMSQDLTPGDAIRMAFQKARSLAPCILFLDELDSLGLKRDSLLLNQSEQNLATDVGVQSNKTNFFEKTKVLENDVVEISNSWIENKSDYLTNQLRINITNDFNQRKQQERDQVAALTQLLIEIDGVQSNNGILVIGATNRPNVLDPALTRPGRFSKILSLPLPDKPKRVEVLKIYSKQLGWSNLDSREWEYLAQRTKGFSAGDLSAITNQSAILAILKDSKHTLETFENAITILTTYPREKIKKNFEKFDPYFSQREVYYKVSQTIYNYIFKVEGKNAFIELVSRDPNPRQSQISANLNQDKNRLRIRFELENILSFLLAGKAGEILMLLTSKQKDSFYWESDLAKKDFHEATGLIVTMLQDWSLYASKHYAQKFVNIPMNQNDLEYRKNEEVYELLVETSKYLEQQLVNEFKFPVSESLSQKAHWKTDVVQEISNIDGLFAEWSRFHLPDPQETDRNPEWIPPEEYYHQNETKRLDFSNPSVIKDFKIRYFELLLIERDHHAQSILLSSFNKAFLFLEVNRELLDTLSSFLLKRKILRDFEIEKLIF
uniref:Cell division protein n=1 Tax=Pedinomonas tuberculata TaxID=160064 RepID=A0A097KL24_9CHLO|nr:cell division protein [Pedinomonas tuberculata]AIT93889.1 cell division protein [Pedinomonas tuberculata]